MAFGKMLQLKAIPKALLALVIAAVSSLPDLVSLVLRILIIFCSSFIMQLTNIVMDTVRRSNSRQTLSGLCE